MIESTSAPNLSSLQDECLKLLTGVLDVPKAASYMIDNRSNMYCIKHRAVQPGMQREYLEHYQSYDPLHPNKVVDIQTTVQHTNEIASPRDRQENPYFSEFMNRWGILDTVEIYLHTEDRIALGFSLFLGDHQQDFLHADMKKLEYLYNFMQFSLEAYLSSPQQKAFDRICGDYQLTAKERMVVEQILEGLPNKSIANNLCCGLSTIKTHLQHIFEKMDVNSKAEVARLFYLKKAHHH